MNRALTTSTRPNVLSVTACRKLLSPEVNARLSDEEVELIRDELYTLAEILFDCFIASQPPMTNVEGKIRRQGAEASSEATSFFLNFRLLNLLIQRGYVFIDPASHVFVTLTLLESEQSSFLPLIV